MKPAFKRVGLIGKAADRNVAITLRTLIDFLERHKARILLDESIADMDPGSGCNIVNRHLLAMKCDLAIVVGGDGTLLNAARSLAEPGVAVLGINLGRLGFLVDVSPEDMTRQLEKIFAGEYSEEERTLLHATVTRQDKPVDDSTALNDVTIHKKDIARMIELDTWIDGHFLNTNRSDGLIIASPTGSTAYALSGGGPILHPSLEALTLVPICPHTLSNRPIVIHDSSTIEIVIHQGALQAQISCDGQINVTLDPGDRITVRKHDHTLRLIHPPGYDYFDILRKKLRWSEQP
ncbi:MAG: NAD(+) kinase [Pseudomonadota bacterium]|jgi:NAD+ kinase|nr:NAD(+) kinase [Pseudomonadota bacterium]